MRLYLSSFRLGNRPQELLRLLSGRTITALIGNAIDFLPPQERSASIAQEKERLQSIGLYPIEMDLRAYFGKADELKGVLTAFDLVWVRGGNTFVLRQAMHQSGADAIIQEALGKDALVYGGYSAGVCVLAPSLHGIELCDDAAVVPEGYEPLHDWRGLAILPYSVAPHYKSDHPESAANDQIVDYFINNHILFKALRDGEAIVIAGDYEVVLG